MSDKTRAAITARQERKAAAIVPAPRPGKAKDHKVEPSIETDKPAPEQPES